MSAASTVPPRLAEIIEDFQFAEGREKVELLIQYAETLPPLPDQLINHQDNMERIEECMTPVFVKAEVENGGMHFYFTVPRESPTVRGFAAILGAGLDGLRPEEILRVPNDFFQQMGLDRMLTAQRLNGISAILAHMKRLAREAIETK